MIEIIDNFLEQSYIDYIDNSVEDFDWKYCKNISINKDDTTPWLHGISRGLFDIEEKVSFQDRKAELFIPVILKIEDAFNLKKNSLIRARLDLTLRSPTNIIQTPHRDLAYKHYASILYCNNSDGNTVIYNEKKLSPEYTIQKIIEPKKNRLVFFDGEYIHTGHSPCKNNYRMLLNTNFLC